MRSAADDAFTPNGPDVQRHLKRRKVSTSGFFADSSDESDVAEVPSSPAEDELVRYLALPQIKCKADADVIAWWVKHTAEFPNVAVMARQYLGTPASSASVERLFSQVGIAFSDKRKSAGEGTIADLMFARANLPVLPSAAAKP